ncbi:hypothetical protein GOODEAATRI_029585, partial [Goodea atripinnis]
LITADIPRGLEKEARTASHAFLHARPGSESYPATSWPFKEPNMPLLYGSAGPATDPHVDVSSTPKTTPLQHGSRKR